MKSSRQIAFFTQGGQKWIAGVIYNHNLIRAINRLPAQQRPRLHAIAGLSHDSSHQKELGALTPPVHYYCYTQGYSRPQKIEFVKQSLLRLRWPTSLEKVALKLNPVIFPVQHSLGKDFPAPWIGWIPDFQHKRMPQFFSAEELAGRDHAYRRLIEEGRHLVVSSQDAYKDLMTWFEVPKEKVSVLPFVSMIDPQWLAEDPRQVLAEFHLPAKFLMFPSQFWAHKNHLTVFKALRLLKERGHSDVTLVCTGFMQDYRRPEHAPMLLDYLKSHGLEKSIHFLGLIPRRKQVQLMRQCAAVLQPSLFEGWSSLVEDARALGKNIFLSNIPVHREQDPPHAAYFEPEDEAQLAQLIAASWDRLRPGRDYLRETQALLEQDRRALVFAENFLSITERAAKL